GWGQWHEDVIVNRVSRDAVGVAVRGNVLQPLSGPGIDDSENRAGGHVPRRRVVVVVAGVIPGFVHEPDIVDGSEDFAGGAVNDDGGRRERTPVMIGATHKDIRTRPKIQTGRHAVEYLKTVDDRRNSKWRAPREGVEGIDLVDSSEGDVAGGISIRQEEMAGIGVIYHATQPRRCNLRSTKGRDKTCTVARHIRTCDSYAMARGAGRHTGEVSELERRIRAGNTCIGPSVIYHGVDIIGRRTIVVDLPKDARGQILGEGRRVWPAGAKGCIGIDGEAVQLLLG